MSWDSVPWFTEGEAEHSSEVARLLAYAAFGGAQGVVGAGDLQVRALATPGAAVQVLPGACAITNRATGSAYQSYAARLPVGEQAPIAATGSAARSDLVVARVENPFSYGETWPNPSDPKVGPYIFTRVISGVPKTTTSVRQIRPSDSAITLARIDIPANTSSITQAMVKDLRRMVRPRKDRSIHTASPNGNQNWYGDKGVWHQWPAMARWQVDVPEWATQARITMTIAGTQVIDGNVWGGCAFRVGDQQGQSVQFESTSARINLISADTLPIPAAMRGTTQWLEALILLDKKLPGWLQADVVTTAIADVEWAETPEA
ncbi:hypothetical protein [Streptomyces rimosus]|uniref:hypothetical protein n=1 Tax=Streptomyces rimosus TaxID=1927 RepID=UPI0004BE9484|nr:hypothetical protein [Streptomyces rimosus]